MFHLSVAADSEISVKNNTFVPVFWVQQSRRSGVTAVRRSEVPAAFRWCVERRSSAWIRRHAAIAAIIVMLL
jgi:hypothetical protein